MDKKKSKSIKKKSYNIIEWLFLLFFAIYIIIILTLACIPGNDLPSGIKPTASLCFHFIEFFVLALFIVGFIFHFTNLRPINTTLFLGVSFAFLTETIQLFIPGRYFGLEDIFANIAGLSTGLVVIFIMIEYTIFTLSKYTRGF